MGCKKSNLSSFLVLTCRFRWIACLEYLRHCLRQHIRRALDELLETLDVTYDRALEDIGEENWGHAHRLFQRVSAASCPLRIKELAEFLAFDLTSETYRDDWRDGNTARAVLNTCSSLFAVVDVDSLQVIRSARFSGKENVTSERLAQAIPFPDATFFTINYCAPLG